MLNDFLAGALYLAGFVFAVSWFGFFKSVVSYKTEYAGNDRVGEFLVSCVFGLLSALCFVLSVHIAGVSL